MIAQNHARVEMYFRKFSSEKQFIFLYQNRLQKILEIADNTRVWEQTLVETYVKCEAVLGSYFTWNTFVLLLGTKRTLNDDPGAWNKVAKNFADT
jgi:hypothetical protein